MKTFIIGLVATAALAGALPAMAQSIPAREQMQQRQIEQGARIGALTPRQTQRLERREQVAHRFVVRLREAHGGRLTHYDRVVVRRVLDRDSRAIHRLTHTGRIG